MRLILLILLTLSLAFPMTSGAQSVPGEISIAQGGELWIEGSAGPVDYRCNAEELSGSGQITNRSQPQSAVTNEGDVHISVILPVKSLNCGKRGMNKDMYEALKADKHPTITYQLLDASASINQDSLFIDKDWMEIHTRGIMEIAGVQDTTTVIVQGKLLDNNQFRVKGMKELHMDTYDIDPPSKIFGLIKAKKQLFVHFDVRVILQDQGFSDLMESASLR